MSITILANNNNGIPSRDGARAKLRNVIRGFSELGHNINLIDVANRKKLPLILLKFIKALKKDDVVIIMLAVNGSRFFLRISPFFHRRAKLILCPIGIGPVRKIIDKKLNKSQLDDFVNCRNFFGLRDLSIRRCMSSIDKVVVENDFLKNLYQFFYGIENVEVLTNFRFIYPDFQHIDFNSNCLRMVFFSRVTKSKGILDLLYCVRELALAGKPVFLDIYGDLYLNKEDTALFHSLVSGNIRYLGPADNLKSVEILSKYDLHCLPTYFEGTPGSLIEAIIATTPTLCTSLPQILELIDDGVDGFIVPVKNRIALKNKIAFVCEHMYLLPTMSNLLSKKRKEFLFDAQKENFARAFLIK